MNQVPYNVKKNIYWRKALLQKKDKYELHLFSTRKLYYCLNMNHMVKSVTRVKRIIKNSD